MSKHKNGNRQKICVTISYGLKSALVEQDPLKCQDWVLSDINFT